MADWHGPLLAGQRPSSLAVSDQHPTRLHLRLLRDLEDLDFRTRRGLDRSQIASLSSCDWIRCGQNLLIHGATGCGKTFLGCAFAHQACRQGLSALYLRAPRLFEELGLCHADGSFRKRLATIAKVDLVVIDDFAISSIGPRERNDLLELLDDRVGTRSTLITSQLPLELWTTTSAIPRLPTRSSFALTAGPSQGSMWSSCAG